jgi:hypothetical protein
VIRWPRKRTRWFPSFLILNLDTGLPVLNVILNMAGLPEPAVSDDDVPQRVKDSSRRMSWIRSLLLRTRLDDDVRNQNYAGNGTDDDPYIVEYRTTTAKTP